MILLFWSYALIPLSQAMSISFSTPLFMYFGSIIFFREKVDKQNTLLTCVGFLLTLVIIRPDLSLQLGTFLAILAAITHATAGLLVKKLSETETVLTLMLSMVILMTPITFIPSIYVWKTPNSVNIQILLFSIALVATLGNYFWTKSISIEKPKLATRKSREMVLNVINPVMTETIGGSADLSGSNNTKSLDYYNVVS